MTGKRTASKEEMEQTQQTGKVAEKEEKLSCPVQPAMLQGESIVVGPGTQITVVEVRGNLIRLGITTPTEPPPATQPRLKLKVVIHPEKEGGFSVAVPALPGCYSQGDTLAEARANALEAALCWLEASNDENPFAPEDRSPADVIEEIEL